MVYHFVISTEFGILISNSIETMWASGYDLLNIIIVKYLDVLVCHHLEHELVPCPPNGVTRAHLFFSKNRIVDPYLIEYGSKCFGDLLCPLIKTTGTAYPKKNFR
jgi:hypothetical protein